MITMNCDALALKVLAPSPFNARPLDESEQGKAQIEGLADSIAALGLLQPLVVHSIGTKAKPKWGVVAGARRLAALQVLAKRKVKHELPINFDFVPVIMVEGDEAELRQASIAENTVRVGMTDVQIYRAVRKLKEQANGNVTDEMLAQAYGVGVARMRRILRLAFVHPDILQAYEDDVIDDRCLRAFGMTDNVERQIEVFTALTQEGRLYIGEIRSRLGANDREKVAMLRVVGLEAYREEGGRFTADLFASEPDEGIIEDPDILFRLFAELRQAYADEIVARFPQLTFVDTPPQGQYGPAWDQRAYMEVDQDPAEVEELNRFYDESNQLNTEIEEVLDWDAISEDDWDVMNSPVLAEHVEDVAAKRVRLMEVAAAIAALHRAAEEKPRRLPEKATLLTVAPNGPHFEPTYWFPDRESAGLTKQRTKKVEKTEEEEADAGPALTNRADLWLRGARVQMAVNFLGSQGAAADATRARAHKALVYAMGRQLLHPHHGISDYGLVYNFDGNTFSNSETKLRLPDVSGVPGFEPIYIRDPDVSIGFGQFENFASAEQVDLIAALVFGAKIDPRLGPGVSLVDDVMESLSVPLFARQSWEPDRPFFDLFNKATILGWVASFNDQFRLDLQKRRLDELKEAAVAFFRADEAAASRFGLGKTREAIAAWLPEWLRWSTLEEQLAAKRAKVEARKRVAARVQPEPQDEDEVEYDPETGEVLDDEEEECQA